MQIIAKCPRCGATLQLDGSAADRRIRCRRCHRLFKVPKLKELSRPVKIIRQSKGKVYADEKGKTYG